MRERSRVRQSEGQGTVRPVPHASRSSISSWSATITTAVEAAQEALVEIENILFLIEKNALTDARTRLGEVKEFANNAVNPFVVSGAREGELEDAYRRAAQRPEQPGQQEGFHPGRGDICARWMRSSRKRLPRTRPDFFAMGFYLEEHGTGCPEGTQVEKNAFYAQYLSEHFMDRFVEQATKSIAADDKKYLKKREDAIVALDKAYALIEKSMPEDKALEQMVNEVTRVVGESINPLDVIKDSAARTFRAQPEGLHADLLHRQAHQRRQGKEVRAPDEALQPPGRKGQGARLEGRGGLGHRP